MLALWVNFTLERKLFRSIHRIVISITRIAKKTFWNQKKKFRKKSLFFWLHSCQTSPLNYRAIAENWFLVDIWVSLRKKREVKKAFRKKRRKTVSIFSDCTKKNLNCESNSLTHFLSQILKFSQIFFSNILYPESGINKCYRKKFETGFIKNRKHL